jgi:hypothetical protein
MTEIQQQADVAQLVEQPIRNRQVSGSSPLVGSILSSTCDQFDLLHNCCTSYSCFQLLHGVGHNLGYRLDVAPLRRADIFVGGDLFIVPWPKRKM